MKIFLFNNKLSSLRQSQIYNRNLFTTLLLRLGGSFGAGAAEAAGARGGGKASISTSALFLNNYKSNKFGICKYPVPVNVTLNRSISYGSVNLLNASPSSYGAGAAHTNNSSHFDFINLNNNEKIINNNSFSILSTMIPNKDKSQLFTSTLLYSKRLDFNEINEFILSNPNNFNVDILNNSFVLDEEEIIIFNIILDFENSVKLEIKNYGKLIVKSMGILHFLTELQLSNFDSLIFNGWGAEDRNKKKYKTVPLIIYNDLSWSNILLFYKLLNIPISGGFNQYRHKLNNLHYNLTSYLNLLCMEDTSLIKLILNNNMKDLTKNEPYISKQVYSECKYLTDFNLLNIENNIIDLYKVQENKKFFIESEHFFKKNQTLKFVLSYIKLKIEINNLESNINKFYEINISETENISPADAAYAPSWRSRAREGGSKYQQRLLNKKEREKKDSTNLNIELKNKKEILNKYLNILAKKNMNFPDSLIEMFQKGQNDKGLNHIFNNYIN